MHLTLSRLILFLPLSLFFLAYNCRHEDEPVIIDPPIGPPPGTTEIPASAQRSGDAAAGYQYLIYGNYVGSGIPLAIFKQLFGGNNTDDLNRTGDNDGIRYSFNAITNFNGVKVAAPSCLTCHAETLNGQLVVGLGNNTTDYTVNQASNFQMADFAVKFAYGQPSAEWDAYYPLSRGFQAIGPLVLTKVRGPNPADKIFATLSAHRRAGDLSWLDAAQFAVPTETTPTDVPAWWLMKKKNALYYNGLGRGDFGRLSAASGMLTMTDSTEARQTDAHFPDVMAWIRQLEPPAYPFAVDQNLVATGRTVFEANCSKCHGTYGQTETYPNLLVEVATVGTDPLLAQVYSQYPQYHTWYNDSWFNRDQHKASLEPTGGYVAPPLDGIWATAPYLHNASVPTIEDLLNSAQRPKYWKRTFDNADYDPLKMGWRYTVESSQTSAAVYNTTLPGYTNGGHTFGDALTSSERSALLEYLKTL